MPRAVPALFLSALLAASPLTALTALTPGSAAALTVDQYHAMPATGTVTLQGHGFGHGHGMSQYGAEGAARRGLTWEQIVAFYYPGTKRTTVASVVKVLVSADTSRDVVVAPRAGLKVKDMRTREWWDLPTNGATRWRLEVASGRTVVDYLTDRWRRWRVLSGDGGFTAGGRAITLYVGGTPRRYRGTIVAASPSAGSTDRDTVNWLHIDNYIKGVIPREMPASWSPAAVRSQAVAARTYASYERQYPRARHYEICDTTSCQVYGGYDAEDVRSNDAVRATAGVILTYGGKPAFTQFGSSSGGWTSANQFPYLPSQQDPYDDWAYTDGDAGNPHHDWTTTLDVSRIEKAWPAVGNLKGIRFTSREGAGDWKGRVWRLELSGTKNGAATLVRVSGDDFRSRLGLRSTYFSVAGVRAARRAPSPPAS